MRRVTILIVLGWLAGTLLLSGLDADGRAAEGAALPLQQGPNLLQNPSFEGSFHAWSGINELQVADGWTPWWVEDPNHNPAYFRPEYKRALAAISPNRVLAGESAQQYFTFYASHLAGMYQQVFNVTPGQRYRFTIWTQVWSSVEDDPFQSVSPANPHLFIAIDPTGNWSPGAATVVWSLEAPLDAVLDKWGQMSVEATAQNDVITVFMRTNPDFANKHNDIYWDEASLVAVGQPEPPPPPPTNTPGLPTATLPATNTAAPTPTAPPPTATATVRPTNTIAPTPAPAATETDVPTVTSAARPSPSLTVPARADTDATPTPAGVAQVGSPSPATTATEERGGQPPATSGRSLGRTLAPWLALAGLIIAVVALYIWVGRGRGP